METNPVITVKSDYEIWGLGENVTQIDKMNVRAVLHLGKQLIGRYLEIEVREIAEDYVKFFADGNTYVLKKGEPVCVTYYIGCVTDHDGCDWAEKLYNYWISLD